MNQPKSDCEDIGNNFNSDLTHAVHRGRRNLHVAFLIDSMHGGGAELSVLTVIESLLLRNYKIDLVLLKFRGKRLSLIPDGTNLFVSDQHLHRAQQINQCSISNDEIQWIRRPTGFMQHLKGWFSYLGLLKLENAWLPPRQRHVHWLHTINEYLQSRTPELIVANLNHSYHISILGRKLSSTKIPVIWSIHNDDLAFLKSKNRTYFNELIRDVDGIHAVSRGLADSVKKLFEVPQSTGRTSRSHTNQQRL